MESDLPVIKPKSKKTTSPVMDLTESVVEPFKTTDVESTDSKAVAEDIDMEDPILDADEDGLISPTVIDGDLDGEIEIVPSDNKGKGKAKEIMPVEEVCTNSTPPTSDSLKLLENVDVICSHNMAAPGKAKDMKRIGQVCGFLIICCQLY